MKADITPLIIGLLIYFSSLVSLRFAISVAIVEILLGMVAGNLGLHTEEWMTYLAGFGGIVLTFLAGAEIDTRMMRDKFRESFLIGSFHLAVRGGQDLSNVSTTTVPAAEVPGTTPLQGRKDTLARLEKTMKTMSTDKGDTS